MSVRGKLALQHTHSCGVETRQQGRKKQGVRIRRLFTERNEGTRKIAMQYALPMTCSLNLNNIAALHMRT